MKIRNFTHHEILIEHCDIEEHRPDTGLLGNFTTRIVPRDTVPGCRISLSIRCLARSSVELQISKSQLTQQTFVLAFVVNALPYQVLLECSSCRSYCIRSGNGQDSSLLAAQHPDQPSLLAVYHPDHHCLMLTPAVPYHCWMRDLSDLHSLAALSIPGTHNSAAHHKAIPSVRCQSVSVARQLEQGVRFLDVRVQPNSHESETLQLVHGVFSVSMAGSRNFRSLLDVVANFLRRCPSECVIMSVKREGSGHISDEQLSQALRRYYLDDPVWYTEARVPVLGEARGKIVLLRRFGLQDEVRWGINADCWPDNTPNAVCEGGDVCIQDFYAVGDSRDFQDKVKFAVEHLQRAGTAGPLFVNFLTASNFWRLDCWPEKVAAILNPAILEYLCLRHDLEQSSTGIVVCDWVGHRGNWDIVHCIIGMNRWSSMPSRVQGEFES